MVKLYTTGCPQCLILEKKLEEKEVTIDEIITDTEIMKKEGIMSVPVLEIDGLKHSFMQAVRLVNKLEVSK